MAVLNVSSTAPTRTRRSPWDVYSKLEWRRVARWVGPVSTIVLALALEFLRGTLRVPDPGPLLAVAVVASALAGGRRSGIAAALIADAYALYFYAGHPSGSPTGDTLRAILLTMALPGIGAMVGWARDRFNEDADELVARRAFGRQLDAFSGSLMSEPLESLFIALVDRVPRLVPCDLVALTLADPRDSRHFVRAVHGADPSLMGVEIVPGVGVAGAAIVSRDVVVAQRLKSPIAEASSVSTVAAVPVLVEGRVAATITFGRTLDVQPFTVLEREHMSRVAGATALILGNAELRTEVAESSLRDPLTGLFNRAYLDEAVDQLLALRRRMKPEDRFPMAMAMFDVDGFRRINEQHGRATGDRILQAVGGVLRGRFRTSDTMARVGGDGFLVVMDGMDRATALRAAEDVRNTIRTLPLTSTRGEPIRVTVSAGVAAFEEGDPGAHAAVRSVETALDGARLGGPDSIVAS